MPIEKRWVVKPQGDSAMVEALATELGMSKVLANLLVQRGIDTKEKAQKFFSPALRDLPSRMCLMHQRVVIAPQTGCNLS